MSATEAELQALIDAIDAEITSILSASANLVNYGLGSIRFDKTSRLRELRELRKMYAENISSLSAVEITLYEDPQDPFAGHE